MNLRDGVTTRENMERLIAWFERNLPYWEQRVFRCWVCGKPVDGFWCHSYLETRCYRYFGVSLRHYWKIAKGERVGCPGVDRIDYLLWRQKDQRSYMFQYWFNDPVDYLSRPPTCGGRACKQALRRYGQMWWPVLMIEKCSICGRVLTSSHEVWCSKKCKGKFLVKARRSAFTFEVV